MRIDMESSRQSGFIERTLAAAAADRSGNPRAFAFLAVHNHDGACGQMQKSPAGKVHGQPLPPPKTIPISMCKKGLEDFRNWHEPEVPENGATVWTLDAIYGGTQDPKYAVEHAPVLYARHPAWLVRQERLVAAHSQSVGS
jgi:hypothetical protein